ncbi:hypothetical protein [Neokomagataea anthophila]|uniref:Uncharacterized protein n=1 Tax=Neokomagataea anthophila TaxID=2826925 RepID=A0ABS5E840_9PROT|nr:hypothetical protein [Neokomagataea anthophila]MBR0560080.1 hypothetical protein [Neokomagataea anthophila]
MVDLSRTIIAKSDQLNADDLLGGPITVKVQGVKEGSADQPVAIFYEGCNGKPFYPCKSMRRVLVNVWGRDGVAYAGQSMTLFRDPNVKFGGIMVGGIRISHMSGLEKDMPMALQVTRGSKKLYTVKPLRVQQEPPVQGQGVDKAAEWADKQIQSIHGANTINALESRTSVGAFTKSMQRLEVERPELAEKIKDAISARLQKIQETEIGQQPSEHEEEWV